MSEEIKHRCLFDADDLAMRLDVIVPGDVRMIPRLVDQVMALVRNMGCAAGSEFEVELALNEALANAIVHGCKGDPGKQVRVCVQCDQHRGMLVIVRDPGPGFDPNQLPSPIVGERVFESHGRGIYLINQLMDEVHFERGGTEIWMLKK